MVVENVRVCFVVSTFTRSGPTRDRLKLIHSAPPAFSARSSTSTMALAGQGQSSGSGSSMTHAWARSDRSSASLAIGAVARRSAEMSWRAGAAGSSWRVPRHTREPPFGRMRGHFPPRSAWGRRRCDAASGQEICARAALRGDQSSRGGACLATREDPFSAAKRGGETCACTSTWILSQCVLTPGDVLPPRSGGQVAAKPPVGGSLCACAREDFSALVTRTRGC